MTITRISDAATEPISDTEMEQQLAISDGWDADKVLRNIKAARMAVEVDTDRSLITQTWRMTLDAWPSSGIIKLPKGPVQSVTSLKYIDADGSEQTLVEDTDFKLHKKGHEARITVIDSWPTVNTDQREVIELEYVTGYGDDATDVPSWARESIVVRATELYYAGQHSMKEIYHSLINPNRQIFNYASND